MVISDGKEMHTGKILHGRYPWDMIHPQTGVSCSLYHQCICMFIVIASTSTDHLLPLMAWSRLGQGKLGQGQDVIKTMYTEKVGRREVTLARCHGNTVDTIAS